MKYRQHPMKSKSIPAKQQMNLPKMEHLSIGSQSLLGRKKGEGL